MSARQWSRDLGMGARFAVTGGREAWVRVLLTAVGVGLGVALLLLTTALPSALASRHDRERGRSDMTYSSTVKKKSDRTLLVATSDTTFHDEDVRGRVLQPEGPRAPLPPGVSAFPAVGDMVVSPALDRLLKSPEAKLLRERLVYRVSGTIADSGLVGPHELAYYAGADDLNATETTTGRLERIDAFGSTGQSEAMDPVLLLLVLIVFVVLLMPVGVFIAAAVRFGGERRDRRLAALRLVGADGRMARRIAAGEALAGALVGLVLGAGFFLIGRQLAGMIMLFRVSVFPGDLNPTPALVALVALAVPAAAVAVTLFALRGVVIEPLGVVRTARPSRRRLWWRLLLPLGGLAMLYPMIGQGRTNGDFNEYLVVGGVILLLVGITALLPWVVEAVVARLNSGGVAWQLAVRRLQLSSGTAARMVNGIAVAVAGAIALQMLFAGVDGDYTKVNKNDLTRAQMSMNVPDKVPTDKAVRELSGTRGVTHTTALGRSSLGDGRDEPERQSTVTVGDCAALREAARLPSCEDGDVFAVPDSKWDTATAALSKAGTRLYLDPSYGSSVKGEEIPWTVPKDIKRAGSREDPSGDERGGFLFTTGALPGKAASTVSATVYLQLDESVPDVRELVRNSAARVDPLADAATWTATTQSGKFTSIRTGLFVGAACVLVLIGASLLVSQLEQLRERKKLLSALVAFGTRRRTLSMSVLWQTAIPIALGLLLASIVGLTLGAVLLRMTDTAVSVDWASVLSMTGIGAGVVLLVTLLSLPPLIRLMRPDGLRTE
ncbi:ABC transporter permease [Streptomyces sp. NBC_00638]|uniref:ABC transporter permease n=1 Tax=Streptomyces sp. NBC_00638 TaxID=2975794 RepID=UPI002257185B|nr:ABC transporter permease [Streptomyces sp. NBC_00638]MCX5006053.1 ABC transporter permease [Streptomyces sp. NBC_00638]